MFHVSKSSPRRRKRSRCAIVRCIQRVNQIFYRNGFRVNKAVVFLLCFQAIVAIYSSTFCSMSMPRRCSVPSTRWSIGGRIRTRLGVCGWRGRWSSILGLGWGRTSPRSSSSSPMEFQHFPRKNFQMKFEDWRTWEFESSRSESRIWFVYMTGSTQSCFFGIWIKGLILADTRCIYINRWVNTRHMHA